MTPLAAPGNIKDIIKEAVALQQANQAERAATAKAYGLPTK